MTDPTVATEDPEAFFIVTTVDSQTYELHPGLQVNLTDQYVIFQTQAGIVDTIFPRERIHSMKLISGPPPAPLNVTPITLAHHPASGTGRHR